MSVKLVEAVAGEACTSRIYSRSPNIPTPLNIYSLEYTPMIYCLLVYNIWCPLIKGLLKDKQNATCFSDLREHKLLNKM